MFGLEGDKYDLERGEKLKQFEVKTFIAECQNLRVCQPNKTHQKHAEFNLTPKADPLIFCYIDFSVIFVFLLNLVHQTKQNKQIQSARLAHTEKNNTPENSRFLFCYFSAFLWKITHLKTEKKQKNTKYNQTTPSNAVLVYQDRSQRFFFEFGHTNTTNKTLRQSSWTEKKISIVDKFTVISYRRIMAHSIKINNQVNQPLKPSFTTKKKYVQKTFSIYPTTTPTIECRYQNLEKHL